jgi:hypothetical protein
VRRPQGFEGVWWGTLQAGAQRLRLVFRLQRDADGQLRGTIDSLDQGATGIPISAITVEGNTIRIRSDAVQGEFVGALSEDGKQITGVWKQGGQELPLTLTRGEPPAPKRPQEPKPPFPYRTEEVRVPQPKGKFELAGTLTLPTASRRSPRWCFSQGRGRRTATKRFSGTSRFWCWRTT